MRVDDYCILKPLRVQKQEILIFSERIYKKFSGAHSVSNGLLFFRLERRIGFRNLKEIFKNLLTSVFFVL